MRAIDPILVLAGGGDDVGGSVSGWHANNIVAICEYASCFSGYTLRRKESADWPCLPAGTGASAIQGDYKLKELQVSD
jgi:hypothetical protein